MGRDFVHDVTPRIVGRRFWNAPCQSANHRFEQVDLASLLVDGTIERLDQVLLSHEFDFDIVDTLFGHDVPAEYVNAQCTRDGCTFNRLQP